MPVPKKYWAIEASCIQGIHEALKCVWLCCVLGLIHVLQCGSFHHKICYLSVVGSKRLPNKKTSNDADAWQTHVIFQTFVEPQSRDMKGLWKQCCEMPSWVFFVFYYSVVHERSILPANAFDSSTFHGFMHAPSGFLCHCVHISHGPSTLLPQKLNVSSQSNCVQLCSNESIVVDDHDYDPQWTVVCEWLLQMDQGPEHCICVWW